MSSRLSLSAIVLPDRHPVSEFVAEVRRAEDAGVRTVWTYDHLMWPQLRESAWYACVPLLALAAASTTRVRLGPQVATPNYRHPVPFAKELMTLDQITAGRLEVGLGAGVDGPDALVLGGGPVPRRERTARFAEWLGLLDELLRNPITTVRGARYSAIDAYMIPGCVQRPRVPFTVAAAGKRGFALAAQLGQAWVTYGPYGPAVEPGVWFAALAEQAAAVDDALAAVGRPSASLRRVVQLALDVRWPFESTGRYADLLGRLSELGFDEITVHWTRPDGRGVPSGALDLVAAAHS